MTSFEEIWRWPLPSVEAVVAPVAVLILVMIEAMVSPWASDTP